MAKQIFIGLTTEGTTDARFLESVVERTFIDIAFECNSDVEPYIRYLNVDKVGLGFNEYVEKASQKGADEMGMDILCVHTDADSKDATRAYEEKIKPAKCLLADKENANCRILTPIIPVRMVEAWMLADRDLLKREIGTIVPDERLGINKMPELFADPKEIISNAIRIARQEMPRRRRRDLDISDLYASIGTKIALDKLELLPSYKLFREEVRMAYRELNLLV